MVFYIKVVIYYDSELDGLQTYWFNDTYLCECITKNMKNILIRIQKRNALTFICTFFISQTRLRAPLKLLYYYSEPIW